MLVGKLRILLIRPKKIVQPEHNAMASILPLEVGSSKIARCLALNGAMLMVVGLLCGPAIAAAPFPRLMLTAHIQFLLNGMMSVFAALLIKASLAQIGRRGGLTVIVGHVSAWAVGLAEIAAAFWGASKTLPIAAAQAGAPGAAPWQESLVTVCHVIPAILLLAAWIVLVLGIFRASFD
jgi:(hydroxyamino)benzene mutase